MNVFSTVTPGVIIVGLILPLIISVFKRYVPNASSFVNFTLTVILSIAAALFEMIIDRKVSGSSFNSDNIWATFSAILTVSQFAYQFFFKPQKVADKIEGK